MSYSYSSRLGCLLYFDDVIGDKCLCEPTMLFILGLEAITTEQEEYLKEVPVQGNLIDPETLLPVMELVTDEDRLNTLVIHKDRVGDLFSHIVDYLQYCNTGKIISLSDDEIVFNCNSLKSFMNEKTGTGTDRVCPIILHECNEEINLAPIDSCSSIASKISDIFNHAGYDISDRDIPLLGKGLLTDEATIDAINNYNNSLRSAHKQMKAGRSLYKLLDYKAMYSYALGVLYGCKCISHTDDSMWRTDPSDWYVGEYASLVSTAYEIFKFHYKHAIPKIDNDVRLFEKYKGIQLNKLWNFDSTSVALKSDEKNCESLYIENDSVVSVHIVYSQSTGPQRPIPGSYLNTNDNTWLPLNESLICKDPKRGITHKCDKPIIRYMANNEVKLSKAYKYGNNKYLSPNSTDTYFCYAGNIGWSSFNDKSFRDWSKDNQVLTFVKKGFDSIPSDAVQLARNKSDGQIVVFYKCYLSGKQSDKNRRSLYGILPDSIVEAGLVVVPDDAEFSRIVSDVDFENIYDFPVTPVGYTLTSYYNLESQISLYIYDEDNTMMWNGNDDMPVPIVTFGYSTTPSVKINTFVDSDGDVPLEYDLRHNDNDGYWSSTWEPKEWKQQFESDIVFKLSGNTDIFKNETLVVDNANTYLQFISEPNNNYYVFNNQNVEALSTLPHGFIKLLSLYDVGITTYPCSIIYKDDFGNSLLDSEGNPLVWYDTNTGLYWNGLYGFNRWQELKPSTISVYMYDSFSNVRKQVYDKQDTMQIYIDGAPVSYSTFYANSTYGIIRDTVELFTHDPVTVTECYYDDYSNKYCIPEVTSEWVTKEAVVNLGYKFVDGTTELFIGASAFEVVYDDHPED